MQKGCDGMGEVAMLKDEFKGILDEWTNELFRQKGYIIDNMLFDVDDNVPKIVKVGSDLS